MIRRVLVPVLYPGVADAALALVRSFARRRRLEVNLIHLHEGMPLDPYAFDYVDRESRHDLEAVRAGLEGHDGLTVRVIGTSLRGSSALFEEATRRAVSLIALVHREESRWHRFLYGSLAEDVACASPVSVLSVPSNPPERSIRRILYPYLDGSPSVPGFHQLIDCAQICDADVVLLRLDEKGRDAERDETSEELMRLLDRHEVRAAWEHASGDPADALDRAQRDHSIDLVVIARQAPLWRSTFARRRRLRRLLERFHGPTLVACERTRDAAADDGSLALRART